MSKPFPLTASNVAIAVLALLSLYLQEHLQITQCRVVGACIFLVVLSRVALGPRASVVMGTLPCLLFAIGSLAEANQLPREHMMKNQELSVRDKRILSVMGAIYGLWLGSRSVAHISLKHKLGVLTLAASLRASNWMARQARLGEQFDPVVFANADFMFFGTFLGMLFVGRWKTDRREAHAIGDSLQAAPRTSMRRWVIAIATSVILASLSNLQLVLTMSHSKHCCPRTIPPVPSSSTPALPPYTDA